MRTCILVLSDHFQRLQRRMLELLLLFFENTRKYNSYKSHRKNVLKKTKYLKWQENLRNIIDSDFWWILMVFEADQSSLSWFRIEKNFDSK